VSAVRAYLDALVEVRVENRAAVADELRGWVATLDGPDPAAAALTAAAGTREHQGVVALVAARATISLEDLLARPSTQGAPGLPVPAEDDDPGRLVAVHPRRSYVQHTRGSPSGLHLMSGRSAA